MRISSFQIHQQATNQLQTLGAQAAETQEQIALGKRLTAPSDDPVGAAQLISVNQAIGEREQYLLNNNTADVQLALTDSVLAQITDILQRVQELTIQAGSGVSTAEDREFVSAEISARFDELLSLANLTNASGQYLFSGFKGETPPFEVVDGAIEYAGDGGLRQIQVDRSQFVTVNEPGDELFLQVPQDFTRMTVEQSQVGNATLQGLTVLDQEALDEVFPEKLLIEFNDPSLTGGQANYTIRRASDLRVVENLSNISYNPGEMIEVAGMQLQIEGSPQEGDQFVLNSSRQLSVFDAVLGIAEGLKEVDAVAQPEQFRRLIDQTIAGLNGASDQILNARAEIGSRFNTLAATKDLHEDINLQLTGVKSDIEDLDFSKAVSDLAYQSFVLEAAQQSFIRINGLSLFNRL